MLVREYEGGSTSCTHLYNIHTCHSTMHMKLNMYRRYAMHDVHIHVEERRSY